MWVPALVSSSTDMAWASASVSAVSVSVSASALEKVGCAVACLYQAQKMMRSRWLALVLVLALRRGMESV